MPPADWINRLDTFSGDFQALVDQSRQVVDQLLPTVTPPSAASIRAYQQAGAVDRGTRQGRAAVYGAREVAQVVGTKAMVKDGWPLTKAAQVVSSLSTSQIADAIEKMAPSHDAKNPSMRAQKSINVVASLMGASQDQHQGVQAKALPSSCYTTFPAEPSQLFAQSCFQNASLQEVLPTRRVRQAMDVCNWLHIQVDPEGMRHASPEDIQAAIEEVRRLLSP